MSTFRPILRLSALLLILAALNGCERRDLWVEGSQTATLQLVVDWSQFGQDPTGMTYLFYPHEAGQPIVSSTVGEVRSTPVRLSPGTYDLLLFNLSPDEFSYVEFADMDTFQTSSVHLLPLLQQPSNATLYRRTTSRDTTLVYEHPEPMAEAVLQGITITQEMVDKQNLIHYEDRNEARNTTTADTIRMQPHPIVWDCRIRVFITGIQNLYAVRGSIRGLAGGHWLGLDQATQTGVYHAMDQDDWYTTDRTRAGDTETGYIVYTDFTTFGMQNLDAFSDDDVQLNLQILLRDGTTVLSYHYDVANQIEVYPDQMLLYLSIDVNGPDLPDVEDKTSAGFDAEVVPWEDYTDINVGL